jgi:hypothetical protein
VIEIVGGGGLGVRRPTQLGVGWLVVGLILTLALPLIGGPGAGCGGGTARVPRVIDGDTIVAMPDAHQEKVQKSNKILF